MTAAERSRHEDGVLKWAMGLRVSLEGLCWWIRGWRTTAGWSLRQTLPSFNPSLSSVLLILLQDR
ncbi:unnamed protein product [Fusarium fujikuroi]|uniref:Uncharacterized protein n=1 Tax=Fusarium fujikuroi TaxID=5127 RepID=A0A9Q9U7E6_FUSFU|nr:unnamed protein product [Fusarium fujikuroi]VTT58731.1 unnamed protein product [Fusarium fujikuroi]VZH99936.1 unnamed protein product [Fusarium fujikuroi]